MTGRVSERELKTRLGGIVETFFETLSPKEKDLFVATTVVENLLGDVKSAESLHKAKSVSRKASVALKPFIAGIEQYAAAFDVIANASSTILSPLWGSFRIVLHLAKEYSEYFEKISDMMEIMGLHLSQLRRLPQLFPNNDQLKSFMVEVFQIMFEFCTKARHVFIKASERTSKNHLRAITPVGLSTLIKLVWKPFKIQFGEIRTRLSDVMAKIEFEINLAEKEEAHAERVRAAQERTVQTSRWEETEQFQKRWQSEVEESGMEKITKWLAPADVLSNHTASVKLRYGSTGSWFLDCAEFQNWLKDDTSPIFWLHAIPGAGKTVLTSTVINYLKHEYQSDEVGLAYFFCDYKDPMKQDPSTVLRTLLNQLSSQNIAVYQNVHKFYKDQYKDDRVANLAPPSLDVVRSSFSQFLDASFQKVFIVIDAVDECNDRECILKAISAIGDSVEHIKILVSSREDLLINEEFKDFPNLKMRPMDVSGDIESYVDATLNARIASKKLKVKDEELRKQISDTLVLKAEGMFQWINCQIDHLCKFKTHNAIREALKHLPKTLEDTYLRILQSIDEDHQDIVQKLLKWLVRGAREMTLKELASAIAIDPSAENENVDPDDVMDPEDIVGYCSSLITVSDDQKVSLAHFTVKEFLTSPRIKDTLSVYYVAQEEVHAELAAVCLTYLNYRDFDRRPVASVEEVVPLLDDFSFLEYAAKSWPIHAHHVSTSEDQIHDLIEKLFHCSSQRRGNYDLWLQIYHLQHRRNALTIVPPPHVTPLYYASFLGLSKTVDSLLDEGAETPVELQKTDDPLTAAATEGHATVLDILLKRYFTDDDKEKLIRCLYLAASRGHADATEVLLEAGAPIDGKGGKYGTALQIAALEGHPDVVSILLKKGANVKVVDPRFGTPLSAAAEKGHRRVTKLLLEAGASVQGRGGWYSTPLIAAIVGKDDSIINEMLDNGANVNAQGGRHDCALMAAAALGKIDLVKKLIDLGARVNDENDKGADALHSACCAGRLDVVELLLAHGADVNAKGGKHRNALNAASAEGHLEIVQVLLAAGADVEAFDSHYGNSLQAAAFYGHKDIVRVLADAGVDVNMEGGVRGTALVSAASAGNLEMVKLLVELGVPMENTYDTANATIIAVRKGHEELVRYFISNGVDIDGMGELRSTEEWTPLALAAHKGNEHLVQVLLDLGASVEAEAGLHVTPLIAAIDSDHSNQKVLEMLLAAGSDANELVTPGSKEKSGCALIAAIRRGDIQAVKLLLDHGADPNTVNGDECTPLMTAVRLQNEAIIDILMERGADVNLCCEPNLDLDEDHVTVTALEVAAEYGHVALIHRLVGEGALLEVESDDTFFKTALQCAAYYGQAESISTLLDLGSDVHVVGGTFGTALQAAALSENEKCVDLLVAAGADVNQHHVGQYGTALIAACCGDYSNWEAYKANGFHALLRHGADVNLNGGGEVPYPIIAMACYGDADGLRILIEAGADVNKTGGKWHSALQASFCDDSDTDIEKLEILLQAGADVNAVGGTYGTALSCAYRSGYYTAISLLYRHGASNTIYGGKWGSALGSAISGACHTLVHQIVQRHKADVNIPCGKWGSPLHFAIIQRSDDEEALIDLFLDNKADVNAIGGVHSTPLGAAVMDGEPGMVERLLEKGADPNLVWEKSGRSPLFLACQTQDLDDINMLLAAGADVHLATKRGSILQSAALGYEDGCVQVIKRILEAGADVNAKTIGPYGTALHAAAVEGNIAAAACLLEHGADVHVKAGTFGSVLQAAAFKGTIALIRILLKHGADVNMLGGRYRTALQAACVAGREKTAKLLLDNGADVNIVGGQYGTALNAACNSGNLTIIRLLLARGADPTIRGGWYGSAFTTAILFHRDDIAKVLMKTQKAKSGDVKNMLDIGKEKPNWKWVFDGAEEMVKEVVEDEEELEVWSESEIVVEDEKDGEDEWEYEDEDEEEEEEDDGEGDETETGEDGESDEESAAPSKTDSGVVLEGVHKKGGAEKVKKDNGLDFSWLRVEEIIDSD
ncbi:ankyrin repeat-containing domain protein [Cadophora sp. MPI-SDFR-AT-0126]|nr:ankyrin repeat-containing domain protein [Leotiomycetes sp. MPI-SDFR-AT-0126]